MTAKDVIVDIATGGIVLGLAAPIVAVLFAGSIRLFRKVAH